MKIIHVDDSKFSLKVTANILKRVFENAEVFSVKPQEFFKKFESNEFDIAIIDLMMPEISGEKIIETIKSKSPNIFLCVLSSNVQEFVKKRLFKKGIDIFLEKPATYEKIKKMEEVYSETKKKVY